MKISFRLLLTSIIFLPLLAFASYTNGINPDQVNFLIVSDIHLDTSPDKQPMNINPSGYDSRNDLDSATFQTLLSEIPKDINPEFVVILGDSAAHNSFKLGTQQQNFTATLQGVTNQFQMPKFNVFGNNDSPVNDYGSFSNGSISPYTMAEAINWKDGFLSTGIQCAKTTNQYPCLNTLTSDNTTYGYFSANLRPKLELIGLNSVEFSVNDEADHSGAAQELNWLTAQLDAAAKTNTSVIIAMHIPPENGQWDSTYLSPFENLIKTYSNVVIGMLASHTHTEELRAIETNGKIIPLIYTSALSTSHGNAPSVKQMILTKNGKTGIWQIQDYVNYHYYLHSSIMIEKYYDFDNEYCNNLDISVSSCLNNLIPAGTNSFNANAITMMEKQYYDGNLNNPSLGDADGWVEDY